MSKVEARSQQEQQSRLAVPLLFSAVFVFDFGGHIRKLVDEGQQSCSIATRRGQASRRKQLLPFRIPQRARQHRSSLLAPADTTDSAHDRSRIRWFGGIQIRFQ